MKRDMDFSYMSNAEGPYIEGLYQDYLNDPSSVDEGWKRFFEGFEYALSGAGGKDGAMELSQDGTLRPGKTLQVYRMIHAYRDRGHLKATTNPIKPRKERHANLHLEAFGLSEADLDEKFAIGHVIGLKDAPLREIIKKLEILYCGNIGLESTHIKTAAIREWIKENWELSLNVTNVDTFGIPAEKRKRILNKLNEASVFENFLHTKYVGQKRFSLEGGETTIPAIDAMINMASEFDVEEVIIGMAHRGRLNILANIMQKTYEEIFSEFEGKNLVQGDRQGDGDVKYHLGQHCMHTTPTGKELALYLMPNPSHLETVGPIVAGYVRSKADAFYSEDYSKMLPIVIHGDAALSGQGIGYELAQMSKLEAHKVNGIIHFVINNQIGFTTDWYESRSSHYCTQLAYISDSPVLHVNGDDCDAVVHAVEFAVKYRQRFKQDVYIDMVCYRKYGHNEGDEPRFTQPVMYKIIGKHPDVRTKYAAELVQRGELMGDLVKNMEVEFKKMLQDRLHSVKQETHTYERDEPDNDWNKLRMSTPDDFEKSPGTAVPKDILGQIHQALTTIPDNVHPIRKALKLVEERKKKWVEGHLDWAMAELCAYGSLLLEKSDIRFTGQDVLRGTFTHRHAAFVDEQTNERYHPLNHIAEKQGKYRSYNSLLSEYGCLAFEYGYSICHPNALVMWEAQFGDFANGAQIIIDQFISSAESKWNQHSGIVTLLPHGYEGQGPEHSSARAERYLQLCAEFNMVVANPTTPANFFHLIRRQLHWPFRKPLTVFTPKSLLRHPQCVSKLDELSAGQFEEFIDDPTVDADDVKRVLLCTGKIFYDLREHQLAAERKDVAIVRLEQLHPIPFKRFDECMQKYKKAQFMWVQEEPKNMGFWNYILRKLDYYKLELVSRKSSASTATGYPAIHASEQMEIVKKAFE